jgi:hypothetical protein
MDLVPPVMPSQKSTYTPVRKTGTTSSLETTNQYARADLETKRKALEQVETSAQRTKPPPWRRDSELLSWLDSL